MASHRRDIAPVDPCFPPTPSPSPAEQVHPHSSSDVQPGSDGFTQDEILDAIKPKPEQPWQPPKDYLESDIRDLQPGRQHVKFAGRVANMFGMPVSSKGPRSAKGCIKLRVKDDTSVITVRVYYESKQSCLRLGSLVSIWTRSGELMEKKALTAYLPDFGYSLQWSKWRSL